MFSGGKTLVIQADSSDTVALVHRKIHVPAIEQRLIYRGKKLELAQKLSEYGIQDDVTLQLVTRMHSSRHPYMWKLMNDLNSLIHDLCNCNDNTDININVTHMTKMLTDFLEMTPKDGTNKSEEYPQIFTHSSIPAVLVKLYVSPSVTKKQAAHECIRQFVDSGKTLFVYPVTVYRLFAPILFEFCKILREVVGVDDALYIFCRSNSCKTLFTNRVTVYRLFAPILFEFCKILRGAAGVDDTLYIFCHSSLAKMMEWYVHNVKYKLRLQDVFPFVHELATRLSHALELSVQSTEFIQLSESDVREFIKFMHPVKCAIWRQKEFGSLVSFPSLMQDEAGNEGSEINDVRSIFCDLLEKLELCLKKVEIQLGLANIERGEPIVRCWSQYLLILKELERVSKLYKSLKEMFWEKMTQRRVVLCFLIGKLSKKSTDYQWILEHKEVTNFKIRQRFALKMLREGRQKNEELYKMLICSSCLFEDSFEYIGHGKAIGPGVLRGWFSLVCEAIFNPQNALFVSCPNDSRRFFPNLASKVDPLHLEYFIFFGRMIALALLHRVQISISFDHIRDADPYLYSSCKKILEMDTKMVDEDILGLTFFCEDVQLGFRKVVELCPNGKNTIVNCENRDNYVNLLVKHHFVTSIAHQVAHFAHGFADIIIDRRLRESFYRILDHEDLNRMLHGSKIVVSIEDWKEHTNYSGYKRDDPQISWLWEIVGSMSTEQRNVLLFFWTSIKSLLVEGFGGLDSKLHIYQTLDSHDCLPSSHTCFYRLCFPPYPSIDVMQNRLNIITQTYVGCSFGAE
ncbi:hypothetical protein R3W88_034031 [Solanum pinnatisectum]|uniref:HECT-type E3 ubiquitin transferase n=1 Tax=Solanum pinnatisectum TaxID=50273 RepID=A0AAV9K0Z0_9SOLN|nr:hypothetical protein R3W88_034031 [Solanum pinnatisectum]